MRRLSLVVGGALLATFLFASTAVAGPPGPPSRGVMEPASNGCPWPDFANGFLAAAGVLKCLPAQIPWSASQGPEGQVDYGVRIVADPLIAVDGSDADGWFVFWCQFRAGLKYQIIVTGLAAHATYGVHAEGFAFGPGGATAVMFHLGTIRTDANGGGVLGGVLGLPPGGYELDVTIIDDGGARLSIPADDLVGFSVLR